MSKIFPAEYFHFSRLTFFFGIFIILSSSFMRQLMNFIKAIVGQEGFPIVILTVLFAASALFLIFIIRANLGVKKTFIFIAATTVCLALIWKIEIPEERIHILEFSFLGWLAAQDALRKHGNFKKIVMALIFVLSVGILDELFQAILPYRYFQVWDILLNSLGGILGVTLFLIYKKQKG